MNKAIACILDITPEYGRTKHLRQDKSGGSKPPHFWAGPVEKLRNGGIFKEQYDGFRYTFPAEDAAQPWAKVPLQELSGILIEALKDR